MKTPKDLRHKARMKLLEDSYAYKLNPETMPLAEDIYKYDKTLYTKIKHSIDTHTTEIDQIIVEASKRNLAEIKNIEYIILQIALAEGLMEQHTPYKVAIDEAIELTREYSDEVSTNFISGVLGAAFDSHNK